MAVRGRVRRHGVVGRRCAVREHRLRGRVRAVPGAGQVNEEPVFREPWEAQAFALTVALHERGAFSWPEWSAALAEEIERAGETDSGEAYYHHWLRALERLVAQRRLTDAET